MNKILALTAWLLLVSSFDVQSKSAAEKAAEKSLAAVTVFLDVTKLTRKHTAARNMSQSHQEFAQYGYELVDVSPYTENGDLEGFFVSYKKRNALGSSFKSVPD